MIAERWTILAALTLARAAMGFQFQTMAAVGPTASAALGLSDAVLGVAIGLYLAPGVAVALAGGWLGRRFGDKRVVLVGLFLMVAGGALLSRADSIPALLAGRALAGAGAVLLNVLVTKMAADWFAERELVAAMGVLISSWPIGIAGALLIAPPLAEAGGWTAPMALSAGCAGVGLILIALTYRAPPRATGAASPRAAPLSARERSLALLAGAVWTFYNIGFILVLAFGAQALSARGLEPVAAAALISLAGWLIIPGLIGGGWVAERLGRGDAALLGSLALSAALILLLPVSGAAAAALTAALGLAFGPAGPLIMALPVAAVRPETRAVSLGIYWTCYYLGMTLAPPVAGLAREAAGAPDAPLLLAAASLGLSALALAAYRRLQARPEPAR